MESAEALFFNLSNDWYTGSEPAFYDVEQLPATAILRENYQVIRDEIEEYYTSKGHRIGPNFTPYAYRETGWRTVNLYSYFVRYEAKCRDFPKIDSIVRQIPGMCLAQIAVLEPHTKVKAHFGDTNALVRSHLGIVVPGKLPEIGICVGREKRAWGEGEVLALQIARRHRAWNDTDSPRIILVVDVVRPEYLDRRYEIASKALASIAMKFCATRLPILKKLPRPVVRAIHALTSVVFRVRLWLQRTLR